mmetsp:Transcript_12316/g.37751  ORF Transcript_12316/g.37751 Transcript_12316/m.37751 type:complete len:97 (-) Transcript_12316:1917-2207(-)
MVGVFCAVDGFARDSRAEVGPMGLGAEAATDVVPAQALAAETTASPDAANEVVDLPRFLAWLRRPRPSQGHRLLLFLGAATLAIPSAADAGPLSRQ